MILIWDNFEKLNQSNYFRHENTKNWILKIEEILTPMTAGAKTNQQ